MLESAGVDAIDVKPGWYESRQPVNQMCVPRGAFAYASAALKHVAHVPVSVNTRITDPEMAEALIARGGADYVTLGAPLLADPEWPRKAAAEQDEDIRRCTACGDCWSDLAGRHVPIRCSINARTGQEYRTSLTRATRSKTVWVVGAGPAGLEAARVAATRGHHVTILERDRTLGGGLRRAAIPPFTQEWQTFTAYLTGQLERLNVAVRTGINVTAGDVLTAGPDAVILAIGGMPVRPDVPGSELSRVCTTGDVLDGAPTGSAVVVIGGGGDACEVAEFLCGQGKTVTLVSERQDLASDVGVWSRWVLLERIARSGVRIVAPGTVEAVGGSHVSIAIDGERRTIPSDTVVCALGFEPDDRLRAALEGRVRELHVVRSTDPTSALRGAVQAGFSAGMEV
jgi:2,4-dienoyl-CoA reductase (NADPH2)